MIKELENKYKILKQIGSGGMAQIHLAVDLITKEKVAIKIMEPSFKNDVIKRKRFNQEMRLMKKVNSPFVVKYIDGAMTEDHAYIIMDYIDGWILKDYIKHKKKINYVDVVNWGIELAKGMDEIHNTGIIHRDIKSQNIMIDSNNQIKIVDFGIAIDETTEDLTKTNVVIGSPHYIAPELVEQKDPSVASDIYAFGIILYEMIAGKVPFSGNDSLDTLLKHQNSWIPKISEVVKGVPRSVENIIIKCTYKNPLDRFKTMEEVQKKLQLALSKNNLNEAPINYFGPIQSKILKQENSKKWLWISISLFSIIAILTIVLLVVFLAK